MAPVTLAAVVAAVAALGSHALHYQLLNCFDQLDSQAYCYKLK
jgi:hypothetical protein